MDMAMGGGREGDDDDCEQKQPPFTFQEGRYKVYLLTYL